MKLTPTRILAILLILSAVMIAYGTDFTGSTKPVMEDPAITLQQKAVRSQYDLQQALNGFGTNSLRTTATLSGTPTVNATLTETNLGATVLNTVQVTGTFWQATQPVSGTVTANLGDTNVGATVLNTPTVNLNGDTNQVKLAGTLPAFASTPTVNAAQSGAWTVTGAGGTFPVTGTFWQATQPVSGTVTANLGNTNVGATVLNTVPVTGTFWQATQPVSGTFWQATQPVSGTVTANLGNTNIGATVLNTPTVNLNGDTNQVKLAGTLPAFAATPTVSAAQSGTWTVTGSGGTFPVTGTFWQATQPVSGTFWQATQPVSGSVTATLANTNVGATVLNVPAVVLSPSPFSVNIAAAANSYQLTSGNPIRMLNVYNTNAGSIYVMFGTNAGFAFEVATNSNTQWSAPAGMVLYDTNIWFRGATGVVNGVTFQ